VSQGSCAAQLQALCLVLGLVCCSATRNHSCWLACKWGILFVPGAALCCCSESPSWQAPADHLLYSFALPAGSGPPSAPKLSACGNLGCCGHVMVQDVTKADFPLPTLGHKLQAFVKEAIHGRGFKLIKGEALAWLGDDWGFGRVQRQPSYRALGVGGGDSESLGGVPRLLFVGDVPPAGVQATCVSACTPGQMPLSPVSRLTPPPARAKAAYCTCAAVLWWQAGATQGAEVPMQSNSAWVGMVWSTRAEARGLPGAGVPVQRWPRRDTVLAYWGVGLYWGRAVSNNKKGHLIGHIKVGRVRGVEAGTWFCLVFAVRGLVGLGPGIAGEGWVG
jgi:hypothetical protein